MSGTVLQAEETEALERDRVLSTLSLHGYFPDGAEPFATGRPDRSTLPFLTSSGAPVVVKLYPSGGGEECWENMAALWRSSFGERRSPPGLPRPLEYLSSIGALVIERLPGCPLAESGEPDADAIEATMRLAASLHECDARPARRRSAERILRSVRRKAERISRLAPGLARDVRRVAEALEAAHATDGDLVPCHGDFSPRNVLVGWKRLALIDWDRFQLADPARDVAYFGTSCWVGRLRRGREGDWSALDLSVAAYLALRPACRIADRLDFHVIAGLLRIADGLLVLWPDEAHLVPRLTAEALRRLEESR